MPTIPPTSAPANTPAKAFLPPPKVESAFIHLKVRSKLQRIANPEALKKIIQIAFQQKRKKVINALEKAFLDKKIIEDRFNELNLDYNLRAEKLSFQDYLSLADSFSKRNNLPGDLFQ